MWNIIASVPSHPCSDKLFPISFCVRIVGGRLTSCILTSVIVSDT